MTTHAARLAGSSTETGGLDAGRILVVDDERNITFVIQAILRKAGYEAVVFNDSSEALSVLGAEEFDTVITDLYMPGPGGMEVLEYCQANHPALPVVFITAYGTVESAVSALKRGAFDFITKPFDQAEILNAVRKAVQTHRRRQKEPISIQQREVPGQTAPIAPISSIIGASPGMQEVFKIIAKTASSPSSVLVCGESGTGKELVAYEIHRCSDRARKPFIRINCAAIPAMLIDSELFGHEPGAFAGAVASKPGKFELAHEGTLFLDEVAELPPETQIRILHALREREIERIGGINPIRVDVRVIAATHRDLEAEARAGRFREDLHYQLSVVPIHLPPLRERKEDIDLLTRYFLGRFNERLRKELTGITAEALVALRNYEWPGNIRQLENVLERMVLMCEGSVLRLEDLPDEVTHSTGFSPQMPEAGSRDGGEQASSLTRFKDLVKSRTQNVERDLIEKALEETGGNVTRTAERLGLSRKGLQLKIKELRLRKPSRE